MQEYVAYLVLGVVQGLTEFLPVSSTGHLIVVRELLPLSPNEGLAVDAVLHLATAFAVALYFRRDLVRLARSALAWVGGGVVEAVDRTLLIALVIGTLPAVVLGILFQDTIEHVFREPQWVAYALIAGSVLFFVAERVGKQQRELSVGRGFIIGLFQALALVPGISRSGATISGGLLLGLKREDAARFAFLLSFPVILGAGLLKMGEVEMSGGVILAFIAAFVSGLAAISFLMKYLRTNSLDIFIVYRLILAGIILYFL